MDIERIKNRYKRLPQYVRDAIASFDVASVVQEIVKEHRLHIDQGGELADEIDNVLVGDTEREVFLPNIKKRLRIDNETAKEIVGEVNENILVPIKKRMQELKEEDGEEKASSGRPYKEKRGETKVPENVDTEALAQIEKDKYREPIENEDVAFDATGTPNDGPTPSPLNKQQGDRLNEPIDRASVLKEIEDPEENEGVEEVSFEKDSTSPGTEAVTEAKKPPRPSMVRDLISEARKQQTHQAEKYLAREKVGETSATQSTEELSESKSEPSANLPKTEQPKEEEEVTPPTESSETRKQEIKNDPYREPIE